CTAAQSLRSSDDDPVYVLFLTDGNPTDGILDTSVLVGLLRKSWAAGVRILCAGVGKDYNPTLLRALAEESGGHFSHIESEGQFATAMGDLLGAAVSVQHASVQVQVIPGDGFSITKDFASHQVNEVFGRGHLVRMPDVFAESRSGVGFELKLGTLGSQPPSDPVKVCSIEIRGVDVTTGDSWAITKEVTVLVKASGTAKAEWNTAAFDVLLRIMAQVASKRALALADTGDFAGAVACADQALRFADFCNMYCGVDIGDAKEMLRSVRETVSDPMNFRRDRHERSATTMWFGGTGSAGDGQSTTQSRMTQSFKLSPKQLDAPKKEGSSE
ncbi:MAG: VWA domain-containing protein, partial [bacterium]|nr:VWA domain-containing protein [bacterium]